MGIIDTSLRGVRGMRRSTPSWTQMGTQLCLKAYQEPPGSFSSVSTPYCCDLKILDLDFEADVHASVQPSPL